MQVFEDDVLSMVDMRYWMKSSDDVDDLEEAVLDDKHNTQLWLKLAYMRLHDRKM